MPPAEGLTGGRCTLANAAFKEKRLSVDLPTSWGREHNAEIVTGEITIADPGAGTDSALQPEDLSPLQLLELVVAFDEAPQIDNVPQVGCRKGMTRVRFRVRNPGVVLPCDPKPKPSSMACNLVSLKITEKHGGRPANRGGNKARLSACQVLLNSDAIANPGVFVIVSGAGNSPPQDALIYDPNKVPVIQVIAGLKDPKEPYNDEQKTFHTTQLEVEVEWQGADHCAQHTEPSIFEQRNGCWVPLESSELVKAGGSVTFNVYRKAQVWDNDTEKKGLKKLLREIYQHLPVPQNLTQYVEGDVPLPSKLTCVRTYKVVVDSCGNNVASSDHADVSRLEAIIQVFPSEEFQLALNVPALNAYQVEKGSEVEQELADKTEDPEHEDPVIDQIPWDDGNLHPGIAYPTLEPSTLGPQKSRSFFRSEPEGLELPVGDDLGAELKAKIVTWLKNKENNLGLALKQHAGKTIENQAAEAVKSLNQLLRVVWGIRAVWNALTDLVPRLGYGLDFQVNVMAGKLTWRWGFKEADNFAVFDWERVEIQLVLVDLQIRVSFGIKLSVWVIKFEATLFGLASLTLPYTQDWEKVPGNSSGEAQLTPPPQTASFKKLDMSKQVTTPDPVRGAKRLTSLKPSPTPVTAEVKPASGWLGAKAAVEFGTTNRARAREASLPSSRPPWIPATRCKAGRCAATRASKSRPTSMACPFRRWRESSASRTSASRVS